MRDGARRSRSGRLHALTLMIPVLLLWLAAPAQAAFRVVDGDTVELNGQKIRLVGIDAPEDGQTCLDAAGQVYDCGDTATRALQMLSTGRNIICVGEERDRYERRLATCFADGNNLNAAMVRLGHALAYRTYSRLFVRDEDAARQASRGLWAGVFDEPWAYRKGERKVAALASARVAQVAAAAKSPLGRPHCPIKGNISSNGRLYHMPGTLNYERTEINEARGERWFCSEIEALTAGWRRAR